jgi:hypothetical protein
MALSGGLHAYLLQKGIEQKVNLTEQCQDGKKLIAQSYSYISDYGHPVRKSPSLYGRKSTPTPKWKAEAYIFCMPIRPNKFSDFFDLCLHWVFVICV